MALIWDRFTPVRPLGLAFALGISALASADPALAQGYSWGPRPPWAFQEEAPLPPRAVMAGLQRRGFSPMSRPRFTGSAYVVDAVSPRGDQVRLVLDAYTGQVLDRERLAEAIMPPRGIGPYRGPEFGFSPPEMPPAQAPVRKRSARTEQPPIRAARPPVAARPDEAQPPASQPSAPQPVLGSTPAPEPAPASTASITAPPVERWEEVRPAPVPPAPPTPVIALPAPPTSVESTAAAANAPPHRSVRVIEGVTSVPSVAREPAKPSNPKPAPGDAPAPGPAAE